MGSWHVAICAAVDTLTCRVYPALSSTRKALVAKSQPPPSTRWRHRKRRSALLETARNLYDLHIQLTGDSWYKMAQRTEISGCIMQRFLARGDAQRSNGGKTLANAEAIFEAMGHTLIPVPELLVPLVKKLVDDHYARQSPPIEEDEESSHHGASTHH